MSAVEYIPREAALSRQRTIELISHEQGADFVTRLRVVEVSDIEEIPASDVIPARSLSARGRYLVQYCPGLVNLAAEKLCAAIDRAVLEDGSDGPA